MPVMSVILSVEDNPVNQALVHAILERHGYHVIDAGTLAAARAALGGGPYAAILLDVNLPDGNALELLQDIKGDARHAETRVIAITGINLDSVKSTALQLGCSEYLVKPLHPRRLVNAVAQSHAG